MKKKMNLPRKYVPEVPAHLRPVPKSYEAKKYTCIFCTYHTNDKHNMKIHEKSYKHQCLAPQKTYDFNNVSDCLEFILKNKLSN